MKIPLFPALAVVSVIAHAANAQGPNTRVPEGVRAHRDIVYVEGGHERHKLDLYLPEKSQGPLPLIIWVHGGGWMNGSKDGCPPLRAGYVESGYAVASINYRLSSHAVFPAQIEDCKAAIRWLRAQAGKYGLDAGRFGVWGSSAGGHLAALLGTSGDAREFDTGAHLDQSSRVQAVCDYYGPTDFTVFVTTPGYESHASDTSPEARLLGGAVMRNKDKAARANPITHISNDDPPFLIVHGDQDPTVPINQSQLLFRELGAAGVNAHFHTIKGAGHGGPGFSGEDIGQMVAAFFNARLKDGISGTGTLATQSTIAPVGGPRAGRDGVRGRSAPEPREASTAKGFKLEGEHWTYREGDLTMSGILLKPEGKGPFPAVLISHGLGGSARSFGLTKAREMVRWGMVCIAPDYTHTGAGGDRVQFGASAENVRRASTCLEILRGMPDVDGARLAAYGHSMGGFVTIGLAASAPGLLKAAAITGSGISPQEGHPAPSTSTAEKVRTPFLMLHGANDTTVRPEQSASLKQVLDSNGVVNDRLIADGQGHPIDQTMREEVFRLIREWFIKNGALGSKSK
ncbi:MAG TPA: alpha/beta fold hydrolase [Prosthecobacter sp.]|nr:alpha/beta fold hydrolase [Prosthecobacter sp.]HRK14826.1 alpha/beta fold hydrolase [Prosthecobacter sp.]